MAESKTVFDFVHDHPELVTEETLAFVQAVRKKPKNAHERSTLAQKVAKLADSLGMPVDHPCRKNHYVLKDWIGGTFRQALERALAIQKLKIQKGTELMYGGRLHTVESIQHDFMIRFDDGSKSSPLGFLSAHAQNP